jgi:hypothetical protein
MLGLAPTMKEHLPGRVDNTTLPTSKPLLPVFDALINSIHAIQDRRALRPGGGSIVITVKRDTAQAQVAGTTGVTGDEPVNGFEITDDGVGFDEANRESFNTADSGIQEGARLEGCRSFPVAQGVHADHRFEHVPR